MSVRISHPWDDRPLTEDEIAKIQADDAQLRTDPETRQKTWMGRSIYYALDRLYLRALRKGLNIEESRVSALNLVFAVGGFLIGWITCVVAMLMITSIWSYAQAKDWVGFTILLLWAVVVVLAVSGWLERGIRALIRKVKGHKPKED